MNTDMHGWLCAMMHWVPTQADMVQFHAMALNATGHVVSNGTDKHLFVLKTSYCDSLFYSAVYTVMCTIILPIYLAWWSTLLTWTLAENNTVDAAIDSQHIPMVTSSTNTSAEVVLVAGESICSHKQTSLKPPQRQHPIHICQFLPLHSHRTGVASVDK